MRILFSIFFACLLALPAAADPLLRVGVLEFGTVNWELDVLRHHGLDRKHGFELEVVGLGSKNATSVALQSGAVDMIVTDYVWVAYQRGNGGDPVFYPHSASAGSVMVRPDAGIDQLTDLAGRELGIAGGPVDKSWLLLQAYYRQQTGAALELEPKFAAPPLLNKLIGRGELPAVLNFWHYSARLEAAGMRPLVSMQTVVEALGVERPVALIGWVFSEAWASEHAALVNAFLAASADAKRILANSDDEWERLRPKTRADSERMLERLRAAYRAGIPASFGPADRAAAAAMYRLYAEHGGERLVGEVRDLPDGVFWTGADF